MRSVFSVSMGWIACLLLCAAAHGQTAPVIDASPTAGVAPLSVSFTATATGAVSLLWDFGDGAVSLKQTHHIPMWSQAPTS